MPVKKTRIMFVDDDLVTGRVMKRNCDNADFSCSIFQHGKDCIEAFKKEGADIVITDLRMPGMNGFELLSELRTIDDTVPVLVMTGYSSVENAVEAMKRGATDFIKKPFDFSELKLMLDRTMQAMQLKKENRQLKSKLGQEQQHFGMVGESPAMLSLFATIDKVADVDCNVVITGDSGTGKELVARALHDYSRRKEAPFITVDCGVLNEAMLENELFGNSGNNEKPGLLEQANGGTLFLDEICHISDKMQMKLMGIIETSTLVRPGSQDEINIDVRIIAASNRNPEQAISDGELRHDFFHRLNVVNLHVPSLQERASDIPLLVDYFINEFSAKYQRNIRGFDSRSIKQLCEANWSGNVRQLRNVIEREVILSEEPVLSWQENIEDNIDDDQVINFSSDNFISLEKLEEKYINHVLQCFNGKKTKAARVLGIDKTTLWRKLRRYDINANNTES